jgi:hypothetical protein
MALSLAPGTPPSALIMPIARTIDAASDAHAGQIEGRRSRRTASSSSAKERGGENCGRLRSIAEIVS